MIQSYSLYSLMPIRLTILALIYLSQFPINYF